MYCITLGISMTVGGCKWQCSDGSKLRVMMKEYLLAMATEVDFRQI